MRSRWYEKIQAAWPVTVVSDSPTALVLYLSAGTSYKIRFQDPGNNARMPIGEWGHTDDEWKSDMLRIMMPGDNHAYLAFWDANHRFSRWYVNLEREYRRTEKGIDFVDHFLDIVIEPDLESWVWKDESELEEAVSIGLISKSQSDAIRGEGHVALTRLKAKLSPFKQGWESWSRESAWPIPSLPPGWQN